MTTLTTSLDGAELCVEHFGRPRDPAIVFLAGATQSMDWWDAGLCRRLADTGRFVVRYDARDTGASTSDPIGAPRYDSRDLADDARRILDDLAVASAHLIGLSMGAGIAQLVAHARPERVRALTLIGATPFGVDVDLPGPDQHVMDLMADPPPDPDWTDRDAAITRIAEDERPYAGPDAYDEAWYHATAARAYDRTRDIAASRVNHFAMLEAEAGTSSIQSAAIEAPALVLHGSHDPLFPPAHGRALADALPRARLVILEGFGHQQPPPARWGEFVSLIRQHDDTAPA